MDDVRAFDATESYLCDVSQDAMSKWRTTSLVTALRGILNRQPQFEHDNPDARTIVFRAAADELTRRGLDAMALIRYECGRAWHRPSSTLLLRAPSSTLNDQAAWLGRTPTLGGRPWAYLNAHHSPTLRHPPRHAHLPISLLPASASC